MAYTNVVLWSDATGVSIYIRQIGSVESGPIAGVKSCTVTRVDDYYDTDVYRDTSDLTSPFTPAQAGTGSYPYTDANGIGDYVANSSAILYSSINPTSGAITISSTAAVPAAGTAGQYITLDDRAMHIPPRVVRKSRSLIQFWNAVNGGGAVLAESWADEYMGMSIAQFETIQ